MHKKISELIAQIPQIRANTVDDLRFLGYVCDEYLELEKAISDVVVQIEINKIMEANLDGGRQKDISVNGP